MNWSCVYCGENGICTQSGNIRYNKICGINEGLMPCKKQDSYKCCGNCKACIESIRKDGTGFCCNTNRMDVYQVELKRAACRYWEIKMEGD